MAPRPTIPDPPPHTLRMAADDYDENGNEVWDEDEEEEEEGGEFEVRNHISINSINFAYSSGKGPR